MSSDSVSGDDVIDDTIDSIGNDSTDSLNGDGLLGTDRFEDTVIGILVGWVVKNVFLDPAGYTLGLFDWAAGLVFDGFENLVRTSLGGVADGIYAAFLGPDGWLPAIRGALVDVAASAGAGSALAAGLANLLLLAIVVGLAYFIARAIAGYLSGGVLS